MVTALPIESIFEGCQMCSSTPIAFTGPPTRAAEPGRRGRLDRGSAGASRHAEVPDDRGGDGVIVAQRADPHDVAWQ